MKKKCDYRGRKWSGTPLKNLFAILLVGVCLTAQAQSSGDKNEFSAAKKIIEDMDSIVSPFGVQEKYNVEINGIKHLVMARGIDKKNPIILFIHGGPASPMIPITWAFQRPLEEYFTMVHYDQRFSGSTYRLNDTLNITNTVKVVQYVDDAIKLAEYIKRRYNKKKLIIIGHSWGTVIAMKAVLKRPDLFFAYIGIGQVINTRENERLSFEFDLRQARLTGNQSAIKELESISPYPGKQAITRLRIIKARSWAQFYGGLSAYRSNADYFFNAPKLSPDYLKEDIQAIDLGNKFTLSKILPEFLEIDLSQIKQFPIPVFMFLGRHDYTTPSKPTEAWLRLVKAPIKKSVWFEHSAHLIPIEETGKMLISLVRDVRPLATEKK